MSDGTPSHFALVDPEPLPTHVARVVARANLAGAEALADTFLMTSYVVESLIKTISIGLCGGLRPASPTIVHKFEYSNMTSFVRTDWGAGKRLSGPVPRSPAPGLLTPNCSLYLHGSRRAGRVPKTSGPRKRYASAG